MLTNKKVRMIACLSVALSSFLWTSCAYAQQAQEEPTQTTSEAQQSNAEQSEEDIERIEVTSNFNDVAMRAFNQGQFDLAEIEFKKNATCARISESNERAAIEGLVNDAVRGDLRGTTGGSNIESNFGNTVAPSVTQGTGLSARSVPTEQVQKRTCSNRGFQLYMVGMSQIQLGMTTEAEKNFESAVFYNKNLYDAHHRLALMKLLRDDVDGAEDEFKTLKRILNRCRKCDARDEIIARVDFVEKALSGEISLR